MTAIDVSLVVTVYNKERYLPATVRSLLAQRETSSLAIEYVFVDDVSPDASLAVIEDLTRGLPDIVIVRNSENAGPSIRLNQGAHIARGRYLQFLDSDDIMAANATFHMHRLLAERQADLLYGQWERTQLPGDQLLGRKIPDAPPFEVSDDPLTFVLTGGRFRRMAQMCERSLYLAAGGADERVFIQDESLPLRLSAHAKRFIALKSPVMFIPHVEGQLSGNVSQLNHDRFLANYYLLTESTSLSARQRALLFSRCLSAWWKEERLRGARAFGSDIFRKYIADNIGLLKENNALLERMFADFARISHVRRTARKRAYAA